jgi:hypothetical protein
MVVVMEEPTHVKQVVLVVLVVVVVGLVAVLEMLMVQQLMVIQVLPLATVVVAVEEEVLHMLLTALLQQVNMEVTE